jgi:serine/threonine protein kinase
VAVISKEDILQDLLDHWETAWAKGSCLSAEELCLDHPELLEEMKGHIRAMKAMDGLLESRKHSYPSTDDPPTNVSRETAADEQRLAAGMEPVAGYRLMSRLGQGGFGEVWKATGPGGFAVALKFVRLAGKAGTVEKHALEVIKDIRHANLLATFGAWQQNGFLVIAMELADRTLFDRFEETKAQNLSGIPGLELLEYLSEAAKGIDFLNASCHAIEDQESVGIQHRDIKPQNLLMVGGCVKVADFGLARFLKHTVTGHTGNLTPSYAAPEFFDGKTHRHSDQYSLAVTYCLLRGGRLPFEGNAAQMMVGHLHRSPDLTMLPDEERSVVARALAKNPAQRWLNCGAFVMALRDCTRLRPSKEHSLRRWGFVGVCLLVLVGFLVLVKSLSSQQSQETNLAETNTGDKEEVKIEAPILQPLQPPVSSVRSTKEAESCNLRGETFRHNNEPEKAIEQFTLALKYDPEFFLAYLNRATAYDDLRQLDQLKRAIDDCNQALKLIPPDAKADLSLAYILRGNAFRHLKAFDEAIADYNKSLQLGPANLGKVYYYRGVCYEGKGDLKHAKADKEMGTKLGYKPNSSTVKKDTKP